MFQRLEPEVRGLERSVAFLLEARLRMHSSCPCPPKALEISKAGEDQESPRTKQYKSVQNGMY